MLNQLKTQIKESYYINLMSVRSFVRPFQSLIRYSTKTAEQNFMKLSGIVHYRVPYCTSYFNFYSNDLGFPRAKQGLYHTKHGGISFCEHCSPYVQFDSMKVFYSAPKRKYICRFQFYQQNRNSFIFVSLQMHIKVYKVHRELLLILFQYYR